MAEEGGRRCAACGLALPDEALRYVLQVDLYAQAEGVSAEGLLAGDAPAELEAILQRLVRMDEAELREEERKVFERFRFSLCPACRLGLRARLWALSRGEAAPPGPEEPVQ